jgi:hypothetical protein
MNRSYENVGRPPIDEKYIFKEDNYLRIIGFLSACRKYKKQPKILELQYELVKKFEPTNKDKNKIKKFLKLKEAQNKKEKKKFLEDTKDWKKSINLLKEWYDISDENYDYALKMSEWTLSDVSYSIFDTLRSYKVYDYLMDNKISESEALVKLEQILKDKKEKDKDKNGSYLKPFSDKYNLFKYIKYLKKTGLIDCSKDKRNKTYFLTQKGLDEIDRRRIKTQRFELLKYIESCSDEEIEKIYEKILIPN